MRTDDSDSDEDDIPEEIPDDLSDTSDEDTPVPILVTQGSKIKTYWEKRSKHLRHDIAIAAWICSPISEVMEDAKSYDGKHHDAVERILRKWFIKEEVSTLAIAQYQIPHLIFFHTSAR